MALNRQERRAALKRHADAVARRGIDLSARSDEQWWQVVVATRSILDILESRDSQRASRAAEWAHAFFENSLAHNRSEHTIACAKGCAFCCHVTVVATAPELLLLARHIREEKGVAFEAALARIRAAEDLTRGLTPMERAQKRRACVLLENDACSAYAARPGACRAMTSISAEACERAFAGDKVAVYTPSLWTGARNAHRQALWAALDAAKLPATDYELNQGLRVALESADAEARWLAGEDVFAAVARQAPPDLIVQARNRRIIDSLIAAATGKDAR
jgi:Fe-S-cluster containining protein